MIDFWERFRGYSKWTQTVATVQSSTLDSVSFGSASEMKAGKGQPLVWQSECKIVWEDLQGNQYTATFEAFEESPLYQLCDGDTVNIRFNPRRPTEFYLRGLFQSDLTYTWKMAIYIIGFILFVIAFLCPEIIRAFFR
jgi:hypothetical protein